MPESVSTSHDEDALHAALLLILGSLSPLSRPHAHHAACVSLCSNRLCVKKRFISGSCKACRCMGCHVSHQPIPTESVADRKCTTKELLKQLGQLSEFEQDVVSSTWPLLSNNMCENGCMVLLAVFQSMPQIKDYFDFRWVLLIIHHRRTYCIVDDNKSS